MIESKTRRTDESKRFEAGLRRLLRTSYTPPEPREEFQESLLDRMKTRQREVAAELRRKRRTRILRITAVGATLAASILIMLNVTWATPAPADTPTPVEVAAWQAPVQGTLEARQADGSFATMQEFTAAAHQVLRTGSGQAGFDLAHGTRLMLDGNSELAFDTAGISLQHGHLRLSLAADAVPVRVELPAHAVMVQPGSVMEFGLANAAHFAPGGRPAAEVALVGGDAQLQRGTETAALTTGQRYRLHSYPALSCLRGESLQRETARSASGWVAPALVNWQYTTREP